MEATDGEKRSCRVAAGSESDEKLGEARGGPFAFSWLGLLAGEQCGKACYYRTGADPDELRFALLELEAAVDERIRGRRRYGR